MTNEKFELAKTLLFNITETKNKIDQFNRFIDVNTVIIYTPNESGLRHTLTKDEVVDIMSWLSTRYLKDLRDLQSEFEAL